MGGCASKSKVLKGDGGDGPLLDPEEKVPATVSSEAKEVAVVQEEVKVVEEGVDAYLKDKEIVEDDKADDYAAKRRSLSLLFKENEGKDSTEDKVPSKLVRQEQEPIKTEEATKEPGLELAQAEKLEAVIKEAPASVVFDSLKEAASKVAPVVGTLKAESPKPETSEKETPKEIPKAPTAETPKAEAPNPKTPEDSPVAAVAETPEPETPKLETTEPETPKLETTEPELSIMETPKPETPTTETPKNESPRAMVAETPKAEAPKPKTSEDSPITAVAEIPEPETPVKETPKLETTKPELSLIEIPKPETETPMPETSKNESSSAPVAETLKAEAPKPETSVKEIPKPETREEETPKPRTSAGETSPPTEEKEN